MVLGTTEEQQRRLGMINNRVFEALSCQAPLVMHPPFPELQQAVGHDSGSVLYASTAAEVRSHVQRLQQDPALRRRMGEGGRRLVVEQHSYDHRVEQIVRFVTRMSTEQPAPMTRPNAPVVVLAYPASSSASDWGLYLSLVPGLLQLERSGLCRLQTVSVATLADLAMACQTADLTLLRAPLGLPLEAGFRSLTTCKGRKGLLVPWPAEGVSSTMAALGENGEEEALLEYSVLGYDQPMPLHRHPNAVWTLGLALALAADRAPSASLPDVTIDITQERGTVARLSWPGSARQEQEMDHVRPETLTSLLGVAARVHLRPGAVSSAAVLGLLGVAVGAEVVVEGGMREAIGEAIGRAQGTEGGRQAEQPVG